MQGHFLARIYVQIMKTAFWLVNERTEMNQARVQKKKKKKDDYSFK